jgi:hypothetical protein
MSLDNALLFHIFMESSLPLPGDCPGRGYRQCIACRAKDGIRDNYCRPGLVPAGEAAKP